MNHNGFTFSDVAQHLNIGEQTAQLYLSDLEKAHLLVKRRFLYSPAEWHLSDNGRRYLADRKLLK